MRRAIVVAIVVGLLAGALAGPVDAKKKKKKKKKSPPITFQAEGALALGNPGDLNGAGVTRQEFLATCSIPGSQGLDGFVVELDDKISKVNAEVSLKGSDASGMYDLDMYFFSESCSPTGEASTAAADEFGVMAAGTKYVLVSAFMGADISFTLDAKQMK